MKLTQHTSDLLVLTDLGAPLRVTGGICVLIGGAFLFAALSPTNQQVMPWIIGTLLPLAGLALIVLPGRVIAAFDRPRHTLVITRRSLRGTTRDEVDFSKITGVEAEQSAGIGSGSRPQAMWRVTIVLQDGTRIPLTSYYSNSPTHATAAAAAREFLGLPAPAAPPAPPASSSGLQLTGGRKTSLTFAAVVAGLFLSLFVGVGGWLYYVQYQRLVTYRPVPAVVILSSVATHRGTGRSSGLTYSPDVTYRYTVSDREYVSARVTPISESRSGRWAYKIAARYKPGDSVIAWYDPARPDQAYLLHEASFLPLIFVIFPLLFGAIALLALRRARNRGAAPPARA